jgi:phage/plasmid-associated DNA primase
VTDATADYRAAMDPLAGFIAECCVIGPDHWTATGELWSAFETWSDGTPPVRRERFHAGLKRQGFEPSRRHHGRGWGGIALVGDTATRDGTECPVNTGGVTP